MAVYTSVDKDQLARFLRDYEIGRLVSFEGIAEGVENSNFLLVTERGKFILTLYERRVRESDLPFFVALMEHLAARGFLCPLPQKRRDGSALGSLCGRPAAIVSFLEGKAVMRPEAAHCQAAGAALAQLHGHGSDFPMRRENSLGIDGWHALARTIGERADTIAPGLADAISREIEFLDAHWPRALPAGVIHADLFPDNVFFEDGRVSGLIDFYFACNDFLAYDLAVMLNAWCFDENHAFRAERARGLIAGYVGVRALSEAETVSLPVLARGAALRFLLTRAFDWLDERKDALVRPKDPREYLAKLRFHQAVRNLEGYGLGA